MLLSTVLCSPDSHRHFLVLDAFHVKADGGDRVHKLVQMELVLLLLKLWSQSKQNATDTETGGFVNDGLLIFYRSPRFHLDAKRNQVRASACPESVLGKYERFSWRDVLEGVQLYSRWPQQAKLYRRKQDQRAFPFSRDGLRRAVH